jgi:hypothetical protein
VRERFEENEMAKTERDILLAILYNLSREGDIKALNEFLNNMSIEQTNSVIEGVSYAEWRKIANKIETRGRINKALLIFIPVLFSVILLVSAFGLIYPKTFPGNFFIKSPTATITMASILPTEKPTVTPSQTPTQVPPTPTPTSIAPSSYWIKDPSRIYPDIPIGYKNIWLLEKEMAKFDPSIEVTSTWKTETSKDINSPRREFYTTSQTGVKAVWEMDQPFPESGKYGIYYLDEAKRSSGSLSFTISDQNTDIPLQLYRGTGEINCIPSNEIDLWDLVGFYEFSSGQKINIQIMFDSNNPNSTFDVNQIMIVQLDEQTVNMIDKLPIGRKVIAVLDNWIDYSIGTPKDIKTIKTWSEEDVRDAWLGKALIGMPMGKSIIRLEPGVEITPGNYGFYVWVPADKNGAMVTYNSILDGKTLQNQTETQINLAKYSGEWVQLSNVNIDRIGLLSIMLSYDPQQLGQGGNIILDAVAIVRIED